jgi:peptidoglycan/xylan/chitin deacetylase (PgdA/CDA1 family)
MLLRDSTKASVILGIMALFAGACVPMQTTQIAPTETHALTTPTRMKMPPATPSPNSSPTATPEPTFVEVTVWTSDPVTPILLYHKFMTGGSHSTATTVRIPDFQMELEKLYEGGYTTVSLENWLAGDLRIQDGRRPLILTMDDAFYRNQIQLLPNNNPLNTTGIGTAWEFSQAHPDFGFHWSIFSCLGDKPYGDSSDPNWQRKLAEVIVWCMENDAKIYNHTYMHSNLAQTDTNAIGSVLSANDTFLRNLLKMVDRQDLIPHLGNILAAPFGKWPRDPQANTAIINYKNPEGLPMQASMDADFIVRPKFMLPPYSDELNPWRIPRMVATIEAVDYLVEHRDEFPVGKTCKLGPVDENKSNDRTYLEALITEAIRAGRCPKGIYATENYVFRAQNSSIEMIYPTSE